MWLVTNVSDDPGNLSNDNKAKKVAWKQHYECLLNEEFSWNSEDLPADPAVGPPIFFFFFFFLIGIRSMQG